MNCLSDMGKNKIKISIEIEDAERFRDELADLLCWWEGFKMGLKVNPDSSQYIIADNGIDKVKELNIKIKDKIHAASK